jgi:hypothetical protein
MLGWLAVAAGCRQGTGTRILLVQVPACTWLAMCQLSAGLVDWLTLCAAAALWLVCAR